MKSIKESYGIEEILFEDDNLTLDVRRASQIFDLMIQEKLNFVWDTPNGVAAFALNEELIRKMVEAGCYRLNLAIESGNQEHLTNNIRKPLRLDKIPKLINCARELGMEVGIFLVIGMPGETEDMMWDSFRFADKLEIYNPFISIATPYPGTAPYETCIENKYLRETFSFDDLFIRSFCITTPEWDEKKLQLILRKGRIWLTKRHIKKHPLQFIRTVFQKLLNDPSKLFYHIRRWIQVLFGISVKP